MRPRSRATLVVLIVVAALIGSATAQGATNPALHDCIAHQALTKQYSLSVLKQALSSMSPETREYSACPDVLNRAIAAAVRSNGKGGTGGGGSGSFLPTPVIIILVILVLAAATFGGIAIRRRRAGDGAGDGQNDRSGSP